MFRYRLSNKELSVKYQDMVLKTILEIPPNAAGCIYQPEHFEQKFPYITSVENLEIILRILHEKGLLDIQFSDISDDCFIDTIFITTKGYDYFPMKFYNELHFWVPVLMSNALSIVAIIISLIALQ